MEIKNTYKPSTMTKKQTAKSVAVDNKKDRKAIPQRQTSLLSFFGKQPQNAKASNNETSTTSNKNEKKEPPNNKLPDNNRSKRKQQQQIKSNLNRSLPSPTCIQ